MSPERLAPTDTDDAYDLYVRRPRPPAPCTSATIRRAADDELDATLGVDASRDGRRVYFPRRKERLAPTDSDTGRRCLRAHDGRAAPARQRQTPAAPTSNVNAPDRGAVQRRDRRASWRPPRALGVLRPRTRSRTCTRVTLTVRIRCPPASAGPGLRRPTKAAAGTGPGPSLPRCAGRRATIVGTNGRGRAARHPPRGRDRPRSGGNDRVLAVGRETTSSAAAPQRPTSAAGAGRDPPVRRARGRDGPARGRLRP